MYPVRVDSDIDRSVDGLRRLIVIVTMTWQLRRLARFDGKRYHRVVTRVPNPSSK